MTFHKANCKARDRHVGMPSRDIPTRAQITLPRATLVPGVEVKPSNGFKKAWIKSLNGTSRTFHMIYKSSSARPRVLHRRISGAGDVRAPQLPGCRLVAVKQIVNRSTELDIIIYMCV